MIQFSNGYDLEDRTAKFGADVILFCRKIILDDITKLIIRQLIRSATSIGANYMEANRASSRKDFKNKIFICKKETQETKHWLKMILVCLPENKEAIDQLRQECHELNLIFQKIINTLKIDNCKLIEN